MTALTDDLRAPVRATRFTIGGAKLFVLRVESAVTARPASLTVAEWAVCRLAIDGRRNAEIAAIRGTSTRTVANQLATAYEKLGVVSRAELAAAMDTTCALARSDQRSRVEASELWHALVAGLWRLVDCFEVGGTRHFVAIENEPSVVALMALTERERQVMRLGARGESNKAIGYSLGLADSTVATHLQSGMRKLRLRARTDLVVLTTLFDPPEQLAETARSAQ